MNEKNKLAIIEAPELKTIESSKADAIRKIFVPMAEMLSEFESGYNSLIADAEREITKEVTARAKRLRLDISRVRIETGKLKDKQKEHIKREDKAIMAVHNTLVWAVTEIEDHLSEIEKHFETQEKLRLEALQRERVELLSEYVDDAHERNLSVLDDDTFEALLAAKKKQFEDAIEAAKKAEIDRVEREEEEAAERARIKAENERLKQEAIEREKIAAAERAERERVARLEAEQRAKEEAARLKKEADEQRKRDAEAKKQREEYERKLAAERAERETLERAEIAEREKLEQLEAQLAKEKAEREKLEAEKERARIAEEKRLANTKQRERNRLDLLHTLNDMDDDNALTPTLICEAIIAGGLPHVNWIG